MIEHAFSPSPWRSLVFVRRNYLVWRKLMLAALVQQLAEPFIWLTLIGYGLGSMVGPVDGVPYLSFLGAGMLCSSVVNAASSEAVYGASGRWKFRRAWEGVLNTPLGPADIVLGEWLWAAIKGSISGVVMLLAMLVMGIADPSSVLWVVPVVMVTGLVFAGFALAVMGWVERDDLLAYYFGLVLMPLTALSGVFFPVDKLPDVLQMAARILPLSHAVDLVRGLTTGAPSPDALKHVLVLCIYAAIGLWCAITIIKKRLTQ